MAWLRRARPADDVQPQVTEIRDEVWKAVLGLPDRQRAAVVLRFYEDQSEERVGQILNCSTKAVNALVDRAKQTLRDIDVEQTPTPWRTHNWTLSRAGPHPAKAA